MSSLSHATVATEITRLLTAQPGTRYSDIVDLIVIHLACPHTRVKSALERMRKEQKIICSGRRRFKIYHLPEQVTGSDDSEVIQRIVPASVAATINAPKFTSGIAQFVYQAGA